MLGRKNKNYIDIKSFSTKNHVINIYTKKEKQV